LLGKIPVNRGKYWEFPQLAFVPGVRNNVIPGGFSGLGHGTR
jgi:hypothetical protein